LLARKFQPLVPILNPPTSSARTDPLATATKRAKKHFFINFLTSDVYCFEYSHRESPLLRDPYLAMALSWSVPVKARFSWVSEKK
jgi:hypothetical protein